MWPKDVEAKAEDIIICSKAWADLQAAISEHQNLYSALCSLQKTWDHMRKHGYLLDLTTVNRLIIMLSTKVSHDTSNLFHSINDSTTKEALVN